MEKALFDRRTFLASSTALGFLGFSGLAPAAQTQPAASGEAGRDRALGAMLDAWFREDLVENPTFATNLGLDTGDLAYLRGKLGDESLAEVQEDRARAVERHRQLQAFGRGGLSPARALDYDIAEFRWDVNATGAR